MVLRWILYVILLAWSEVSTGVVRIESSELSRLCCKHLDDPVLLLSCTNETIYTSSVGIISQIPYMSGKQGPRLMIGILSRSTSEIVQYAAYSHFAQASYASHRNYAMLPLLPDSEEQDYEYFRKLVPILYALNRTDLAFHCDYLVWMDADAIFLDFSFRIEKMVARHPRAHIIMSADVSTTGNTGVMIIRNSIWSKKFIQDWVSQRLFQRDLTDQAGLQRILRIRRDTAGRVVFVPPNDLNSDAPAMGRQKPDDSVLHLAAESDIYRKDVFSISAYEICSSVGEADTATPKQDCSRTSSFTPATEGFLRKQLGLNRACLQHIAVESYRNISKGLFHDAVQNPATVTLQGLRKLRTAVSKYCHAIKYSNNEHETLETVYLRKVLHRLMMYLSRRLRHSLTCEIVDSSSTDSMPDLPGQILNEIRLQEEAEGLLSSAAREGNSGSAECDTLIMLQSADLPEVLKLSCETSYEYFQAIKSVDSMQLQIHKVLFTDDGLFNHVPQVFQVDRENGQGDVFDIFELRLRIASFIRDQLLEMEKSTRPTEMYLIYDLRAGLLSDIGLIRLEQGFLDDALVLLKDAIRLYELIEREFFNVAVDQRAKFNAIALYGGAQCMNKSFDSGINVLVQAITFESDHVGPHHHNLISKLTNVAICYFEKYKHMEDSYRMASPASVSEFIIETQHIEILKASRAYALRALDIIRHNQDILNGQHMKTTVEAHLIKISSYLP